MILNNRTIKRIIKKLMKPCRGVKECRLCGNYYKRCDRASEIEHWWSEHTRVKTFEDLEFKKWQNVGYDAARAFMGFSNGYGISVITGKMAYSDEKHPYEAAVLYKGKLCYTTYITNDVIGYLDEEGVTEVMKRIQEL